MQITDNISKVSLQLLTEPQSRGHPLWLSSPASSQRRGTSGGAEDSLYAWGGGQVSDRTGQSFQISVHHGCTR